MIRPTEVGLITMIAGRLLFRQAGAGAPGLGRSERAPRLGCAERAPRLGRSECDPRLGRSERAPRLGRSECDLW